MRAQGEAGNQHRAKQTKYLVGDGVWTQTNDGIELKGFRDRFRHLPAYSWVGVERREEPPSWEKHFQPATWQREMTCCTLRLARRGASKHTKALGGKRSVYVLNHNF